MTRNAQLVDQIALEIQKNFPTFGGGRVQRAWDNPVAEALKDQPLGFASGVNVRDVINFVGVHIMQHINEQIDEMVATRNSKHIIDVEFTIIRE